MPTTCWVSEMILHTLAALPDSSACSDCLSLLGPGDALLLLGDGVYAALQGSDVLADLEVPLHVLREDAAARGIETTLRDGATLVDMAGFVALTERYPRQQAWY